MLLQKAMHNPKCTHNGSVIKWDLPCVGLMHTTMDHVLGFA